jgi:hypothetical protein
VLQGPLPAAWGALGNLTQLHLVNNSMVGTLPSTWSGLLKLQVLQLQLNRLTGKLSAACVLGTATSGNLPLIVHHLMMSYGLCVIASDHTVVLLQAPCRPLGPRCPTSRR